MVTSVRVLVLCCVTPVPAAGHLASSQVRALPPPGTCHHRTIEAVTRDTRTATEEEGFKVKVPPLRCQAVPSPVGTRGHALVQLLPARVQLTPAT